MIDFRYHLVSIVAVFLALGIGILMGSLVLGDALVDQLRNDLDGLRETNNRRRDEIVQLNRQIDVDQRFALAARPYVIGDRLNDEEIVLFAFEGTDGAVLDEVRTVITDAGGTVVTTVSLREKLALASAIERDELALLLDEISGPGPELRRATGVALGAAFAAAAEPTAAEAQRADLDALVGELEGGSYIDVDRFDNQPLAPTNALFVIAGGSDEAPPFEVAEVAVPLGRELASNGSGVLGAEASASSWQLVEGIRNDVQAGDTVATVDQAESISGGISVVLGLDLADGGTITHSGTDSGAEGIVPPRLEGP